MSRLLDQIEPILLMGPGPSCVAPEVYGALAKPTIGHLDPLFIEIMDAIKGQLQALLQTDNRLTLPISGTGSAGMETCFVNLIEPGDPVLILINGVFGMRMQDVATRLGAEVDILEFEWGTPVIPDQVKSKLDAKTYKIVAVVHAETSTGVRNPVDEIGTLLKASNTIYLVDAVTSLGGIEIAMDRLGHRCPLQRHPEMPILSAGIGAGLSFSEKAVAALDARKTQGAQLVSGSFHDPFLLEGGQPGLPPHRAH
jgi:alanine-glyoxylate transaminase/serine-glyoxylate transaminase/serine-pyruvate transaminase